MWVYAMKLVYALALLGTLSACGGGGGGTTGGTETTQPTPDFSSPGVINPGDPIPTDATFPVLVHGTAIESAFGGGSGFGAFDAPIAATLETSANTTGDPTAGPDALRLTANGETVVIDLRQTASSTDVSFDGTSFNITNDSGSFLILPVAFNASPLQFATFGGWAKTANATSTSTDTIRFGTFGIPTPEASMPKGTSATYSGNSIGLATVTDASSGAAAVGFTRSVVTVTATNFETVTFSSGNTEFSPLGNNTLDRNSLPLLNFEAEGTVSGTGFTATPTNPGRNGQVNGQFYGPNAEEVGGTFGLTGDNINYGGAFGAKQP